MASFALVLAGPDGLLLWEHDGERLTSTRLPAGVHVVTSGGAEDGKTERHLPAFTAQVSASAWQRVVVGSPVADDPASLLVRHEQDRRGVRDRVRAGRRGRAGRPAAGLVAHPGPRRLVDRPLAVSG